VEAVSRPAQFIEKVRDIVGLCMDPPTEALVLCADEKPQIQAYPDRDGAMPADLPARCTHDYMRAAPRVTGPEIATCSLPHIGAEQATTG